MSTGSMLHGAALSVLAGVAAGRVRRSRPTPTVLITISAAAFLMPICWNLILRWTGATDAFSDLPFPVSRRHLTVLGRQHLADGAHVVAVDPATHRSYYPIAHGPDGHPVLLVQAPTGD